MNEQFDYTAQSDPSFVNDVFGTNPPPQKQGHAKGYAITSLILGIASVFCTCVCCCLYYIAILLSVLSIVMAVLAKRDNGGKMPGMAIAGLILAILGLLMFLVMIAFEIFLNTIPEEQLHQYLREYFESLGMDYDEFLASYESGAAE